MIVNFFLEIYAFAFGRSVIVMHRFTYAIIVSFQPIEVVNMFW
jgi:hypothetical protein